MHSGFTSADPVIDTDGAPVAAPLISSIRRVDSAEQIGASIRGTTDGPLAVRLQVSPDDSAGSYRTVDEDVLNGADTGAELRFESFQIFARITIEAVGAGAGTQFTGKAYLMTR